MGGVCREREINDSRILSPLFFREGTRAASSFSYERETEALEGGGFLVDLPFDSALLTMVIRECCAAAQGMYGKKRRDVRGRRKLCKINSDQQLQYLLDFWSSYVLNTPLSLRYTFKIYFLCKIC